MCSVEKFWERIDRSKPDGCWPWKGRLSSKGYATPITVHPPEMAPVGVTANGYALAYYLVKGHHAPGLELDHLCNNPACCNPDHLEPVTHQENIRRVRERATHCRNGHLLIRGNVFTNKRIRRGCKTCWDAGMQRYAEKYYTGNPKGRQPQPLCGKGHPMEGYNLYYSPNGKRYCRECMNANTRKTYAKRVQHQAA